MLCSGFEAYLANIHRRAAVQRRPILLDEIAGIGRWDTLLDEYEDHERTMFSSLQDSSLPSQ